MKRWFFAVALFLVGPPSASAALIIVGPDLEATDEGDVFVESVVAAVKKRTSARVLGPADLGGLRRRRVGSPEVGRALLKARAGRSAYRKLNFDVGAAELAEALAGLESHLLHVSGESLADVALDLGLVRLAAGQAHEAASAFKKARYYGAPEHLDPLVFPPETRRLYDAAAAGTGEPGVVAVRVHPAGARVYLDGRLLGQASMVLPDVPAGRHVLRAEFGQSIPVAREILVVSGQEVLHTLWPLPARQPADLRHPEDHLARQIQVGRFAGARWVVVLEQAASGATEAQVTDALEGRRVLTRRWDAWGGEALQELVAEVHGVVARDQPSASATIFLD